MILAKHLQTGKEAEDRACFYLKSKGYKICERNFRTVHGEIDIICKKAKEIIFVEVRARNKNGQVTASETLSLGKQKKLRDTASEYLSLHKAWDIPCRFDFIAFESTTWELKHFVNVCADW